MRHDIKNVDDGKYKGASHELSPELRGDIGRTINIGCSCRANRGDNGSLAYLSANWEKLLSSQKFDLSDRLAWVLSIMRCLISGDALFNHGCLSKPASLKMLGGRLGKLTLGFQGAN